MVRLSLDEALRLVTDAERERSFIVTDPMQPDNPIVFVNEAFLRLTGYAREEVLGRNCRFLQGPETDPAIRAAVRDAIAGARPITADIRNYRKDGSAFWNRVRIRPIRDDAGRVINFVGVQNPIREDQVRALPLDGIRR